MKGIALHKLFFLMLGMVLSLQPLRAQKIHLALSQHKGKQAVLLGMNGVHKDTLQKITLDNNGKGHFDVQKVKDNAGLVELFIKSATPPDVSLQWIYAPNESPTISSDEYYVQNAGTQIKNSAENTSLQRWFEKESILKQKKLLIQETLKLYQPKETLFAHLTNEAAILTKQQNVLADTLRQSALYAAALLQYRADLEQKLANIWESNHTRNAARNYFRTIDFDKLYHTGLWFEVINPCIEAYVKGSENYEQFGKDVAEGLKRTKNLAAYTDLADATVSICEQFSWWTDQKAIAAFLLADNRLQNPTGRVAKALRIHAVSEGAKAPDLVVTLQNPKPEIRLMPSEQLSDKFSLLVFYETGCGNCENLLEQLKGNAADLQKNGCRIISFAADHSVEMFSKTAKTLPWADNYCDFKGFEGVNFKNFAVMGTPTLYLLDKNGSILTKTATLTEIIQLLNGIKS